MYVDDFPLRFLFNSLNLGMLFRTFSDLSRGEWNYNINIRVITLQITKFSIKVCEFAVSLDAYLTEAQL